MFTRVVMRINVSDKVDPSIMQHDNTSCLKRMRLFQRIRAYHYLFSWKLRHLQLKTDTYNLVTYSHHYVTIDAIIDNYQKRFNVLFDRKCI